MVVDHSVVDVIVPPVKGNQVEALVQSDVQVGGIEGDAVNRTRLPVSRMFHVVHLHGLSVSHVPKSNEAVASGPADQGHVVIGGKAIYGLVKWFFPFPEKKIVKLAHIKIIYAK